MLIYTSGYTGDDTNLYNEELSTSVLQWLSWRATSLYQAAQQAEGKTQV